MQIYNTKNTKPKRLILRKSQTEAEKRLWPCLRNKQFFGIKFYRQFGIGEYITDFYCPQMKLAIEVDGKQHLGDDGMAYDAERSRFFAALDIEVLRFSNSEILDDIESVLENIELELLSVALSPSYF